MNHSVRCPVCDAAVVIDPISSETLAAPSEDLPGSPLEGLVVCSNCGNAIVLNVDELSIDEGSPETDRTTDAWQDLESQSSDGAEHADGLTEKSNGESHEGDLVDQATATLSGDESGMTLELESEALEFDPGSDSESDIDLDVSDHEHTFDASDIDEGLPGQEASHAISTCLHPESFADESHSYESSREGNASSPTPANVARSFESSLQAETDLDSMTSRAMSSGVDDEAEQAQHGSTLNSRTVAEDGDANPPSFESTSNRLEDDAVIDDAVMVPIGGQDWTSIAKRPRTRAQDQSPLWKLLPPVLGGLTALPISIGILWYGFGKDIGNAGPTVARFVPWIVPKHLRGRPQWKSTPVRQPELKKPTLPSGRNSPNLDAGEFGKIGESGTRPTPAAPLDTTPPNLSTTSPPVAPSTDDEAEPLDAERSPDVPPREPVDSPLRQEQDPNASDLARDSRNDNLEPATEPDDCIPSCSSVDGD